MSDLHISSEFYHDEIRCGFYIPTAIKQSWATSLMVLHEIDRICQKYNIEYFADWGTLIGTVRHGGFVPWDDDLDICMKREDYIKFRKVADDELPTEYCIHDYERQEDHWLFLSRVCTSKHISFEESHLDKYHNYPYIGAIDIFVQDYIYRDPMKEKERSESIKYLLALAEAICDGTMGEKTLKANLAEIKKCYGVDISQELSPRDMSVAIYKLIEKRMSEVKEEDSDRLVQIFPWGLKGAKGLPKSYYEKTVRLPFEFTTMPVPQCYNRVLNDRYGDYLQVHKVWSGHIYPAFEGQRANLQAVADFKLPEFEYDSSMIEHKKKTDENSIKAVAKRFTAQLEDLKREINSLMNCVQENDESIEKLLVILAQCQQLAVDFGGLLEETKGEETASVKIVVEQLEEYCDKTYILYAVLSQLSENNVECDVAKALYDVDICMDVLEEVIRHNILNRDTVLFVADGINRLPFLIPYISEAGFVKENDVYITVAPSFFKDIYGNIIASDEEIDASIEQTKEAYGYLNSSVSESGNVNVISWDKVDVEALCPKITYYQNPYDVQNPCLTIPTHLYTSNMRLYTDELIYVAPITDDFEQQDITDVYNMKHYVTAPGVILADRIYVSSERMRDIYIWKLTEFAGTDTKHMWENKISIKVDKHDVKPYVINERKRLLVVVGLNEENEYDSDTLLKSLKKRKDLFEKYKDGIDVTICSYPDESNKKVEDFDAYYGSPSPYVLEFTRAGKPVMIADFEI